MLHVIWKCGRSLGNFISCKSSFYSFSFSAFGPKGHNVWKENSFPNCSCLCLFYHFSAYMAFKQGKAVLPVREPITALKLVGRLVYRLIFCWCIFMPRIPSTHFIIEDVWERKRDDKAAQPSTSSPWQLYHNEKLLLVQRQDDFLLDAKYCLRSWQTGKEVRRAVFLSLFFLSQQLSFVFSAFLTTLFSFM